MKKVIKLKKKGMVEMIKKYLNANRHFRLSNMGYVGNGYTKYLISLDEVLN